MIEIFRMTKGHRCWDKTICFANNCSWSAGPVLAKEMEINNFKEWERVIVVCENDEIAGFCTFAEKDEMPNDYEYTPFIGFVFVSEKFRGHRLSEMMINNAIEYAKYLNYDKIYVVSGEVGLYEKFGFVKIGDYPTIYGWTDQLFEKNIEI